MDQLKEERERERERDRVKIIRCLENENEKGKTDKCSKNNTEERDCGEFKSKYYSYHGKIAQNNIITNIIKYFFREAIIEDIGLT